MILLLAACVGAAPDRPGLLEAESLGNKAIVVGSISQPVDHEGFNAYSLDLLDRSVRRAYRIRIVSGTSPLADGFPADYAAAERKRSLFVKVVEPGKYQLVRQAVEISSSFTSYLFGERGPITREFEVGAGEIVYIGEHAFTPLHEEGFFWRDVQAPRYELIDSLHGDLEVLRELYPAIDWSRTRNLQLQRRSQGVESFEESDVWVYPFG